MSTRSTVATYSPTDFPPPSSQAENNDALLHLLTQIQASNQQLADRMSKLEQQQSLNPGSHMAGHQQSVPASTLYFSNSDARHLGTSHQAVQASNMLTGSHTVDHQQTLARGTDRMANYGFNNPATSGGANASTSIANIIAGGSRTDTRAQDKQQS